ETIFGVTNIDAGEIRVRDQVVKIKSPADAIRAGMAMLTEDRKLTGTMGVLSVKDNMTVAALPRFSRGGILLKARMTAACIEQRAALSIKTPSIDRLIKLLSGGNQQKVLVSRWLLTS